jgi:hypothetical protein
MAQIQELQELLAEQAAGSRSAPTGEVRQLAASRVEFDDIMAFDQVTTETTHCAYQPTLVPPSEDEDED